MEHDTVAKIAASLKEGIVPPAQPRDIEAAVQLIVDELPHTPVDGVRNATKALNGQRLFNHTRTLGEAWQAAWPFDASIAKRYAQALIDLFELDPAETLLTDALVEARKPEAGAQAKSEIPEYQGLLGRIEKQRFVKTGDRDHLVGATNHYLEQLREDEGRDDWFWHAINVIALMAREKELKVAPTHRTIPAPRPDDVLKRMSVLYGQVLDDPWVPATASEACLALGDCDTAELWLYRFLHHPDVLPFNVQSYDRQLREIWGGDPEGTRCVDRLARIIARHVMRTQAQFTISTAAIPALKAKLDNASQEDLEKNFLGESTFSVANVRDMLEACKSIGCVSNRSGARMGTGFLIAGEWLGLGSAGPIFVTNAHVISDTVPKAIAYANALVTFEIESERAKIPVNYEVDKMIFTSPPAKLGVSDPKGLDVTIVTLRPVVAQTATHFVNLPVAKTLPLIENKARAYVIGHPLGGGLQISLHDSVLLDIDDDDRLVHYRTPTDPASSGSPVFNTEWQVIGLHHGGSAKTPRLHGTGDYEANEAISLSAIREAMQQRGIVASSG
jgi:V8-like Glu-specific endopeptidase